MRFGVCAGIESAPLLAAAGYDYIELAAADALSPDEDDQAWAPKRRAIESMPLPVQAFNIFLRGVRVVGPDADLAHAKGYVDVALARAGLVGAEIMVFGSAGARNIPEGFSREQADSQVRDFLTICGAAADRAGVTVAIEPLCKAESNILNLVSEGAALARSLGLARVRGLADTYHMEREEEPLSAIVESADALVHVHTADSGRFAPGSGTYDHVAMFRALRDAGYDRRVSVECSWQNAFETHVGSALKHLKAAHAAALR